MRVQRNESLNGKTWYNVAASLRGSSQSFQLHTFNGSTPVRTRAGNEGAELNELDLTEICQHWWLLCVSGDAPLHTFPSSFSLPLRVSVELRTLWSDWINKLGVIKSCNARGDMTSRAFDLGPLLLCFTNKNYFKRFRQPLVSLNLIAWRRRG